MKKKKAALPKWVNQLACVTHVYLKLLEAKGMTDNEAKAALAEFMLYKGWKETDFGAAKLRMN